MPTEWMHTLPFNTTPDDGTVNCSGIDKVLENVSREFMSGFVRILIGLVHQLIVLLNIKEKGIIIVKQLPNVRQLLPVILEVEMD